MLFHQWDSFYLLKMVLEVLWSLYKKNLQTTITFCYYCCCCYHFQNLFMGNKLQPQELAGR